MSSALARISEPDSFFTIPANDYTEFFRLSASARAEIMLALDALGRISEAGRGKQMRKCSQVAKEIRAERPDLRGFSKQALYAKYLIYTRGGRKTDTKGNPTGPHYTAGDWRVLVKNYTNGGSGLPPEFVGYLVGEWSKTTRGNDAWRSLHARLKQDWLAGKEIPGYGTADTWYPRQGLPRPRGPILRNKDLPPGWSDSNLWRSLKKALPRKSQRTATQGQINRLANTWAGKLLRDRSSLLPMQLWTIDDVRLDLQARMWVDGRWQVVYVDALFALDVATGFVMAYGLKGMATRGTDTEQGRKTGTKMAINGRDVRHLLLSVFQKTGLPPYMSRLVCEENTAKLSRDDEIAFLNLLKDRFEIDYTGIGRGRLLKSGFGEDWGRPGMKGWIEAYFRKLHTSLNHVDGTTGRRYDSSRGDHAQRVKYCEQLVRRAEKLIDGPLTPDHPLNEQIIFPLYTVDEINALVGNMVHELNWRHEHRLQGFERVFEFRDATGNWLPESALNRLAPAERAGMELTPRMEAPAERLVRLLRKQGNPFTSLDPATLSVLYAEHQEATVNGGRITISDQRLSTDALTFVADGLHTLDAYEGRKKAVIACLPEDHSHAVLMDAQSGVHVGTLQREGRVNILDEDAIGRRAGEVKREREAELAHIRTYLGPQENAFAMMRATNDGLLNRDPEAVPAIRTPMGDAFAEADADQAARADRTRKFSRLGDDDDTLTAREEPADICTGDGYIGSPDDLL